MPCPPRRVSILLVLIIPKLHGGRMFSICDDSVKSADFAARKIIVLAQLKPLAIDILTKEAGILPKVTNLKEHKYS